MLKINKDFDFKGLQINKLLKATYYASHNFQYRALFKARDDILKIGKYSNEELEMVLNSILDAETARKYIIEELKTSNILKASEIINRFQFPKEEVIRDLYYMKEKGLIEDIESKSNDLIFKFKIPLKEIKENYFNSVNSVYDNHLCCQCGLCSSVCPVNAVNLTKDYLYIDENRCITCGLCYDLCPCSFKMDNLRESLSKMDKSLRYSEGIGYYRNIYSARTLKYSIRKVGQDGGVVTSLLYYLLEKDLVDAIITIKHLENYWEPEVGIVERVDELYKTAGTTYVHFPVLSILHQAKKFERIAVVALPCKMKALSKGELIPIKFPILENIQYKIGLFCMESFPYEKMFKLIKDKFSVSVDEIIKMDINHNLFELTVDSGEKFSVPIKDCKNYSSNFCHYCRDLTAEYADISLGSIGSDEGWSTIIARTYEGEKLVKDAVKNESIEIKSFIGDSPVQSKIKIVADKKRKNSIPIEIPTVI